MDNDKLAEVFVELADTLVDDFDVFDMLHVLTTQCVELLGAAAAGLLLTEVGGQLRLVVTSSEQTQLLELFELQQDEGPCVECFRTGQPVTAQPLQHAQTRWPNFAPAAVSVGFVSVTAVPMRLRGQVIGALNLFATADSPQLDDQQLRIAQALTDAATIAILQDRLARSRQVLNQQLQGALNSRIAIEQAKGALAAHHDIATDEAFDLLRSHARTNRRRLTEVAEDIVAGNWTLIANPSKR